jgi:hypothetical protein
LTLFLAVGADAGIPIADLIVPAIIDALPGLTRLAGAAVSVGAALRWADALPTLTGRATTASGAVRLWLALALLALSAYGAALLTLLLFFMLLRLDIDDEGTAQAQRREETQSRAPGGEGTERLGEAIEASAIHRSSSSMIRDGAQRGCSTIAHPPPIILGLCAWRIAEHTEETCRTNRFVRCRESVISAKPG